MKAAFASLARWFFKVLYRICCFLPRRNEVLFLSRQVDEPGYNFRSLGSEFQRRGWIVFYLTKRLSKRAVASYSFHVVREIYHLARCRVCVLDRYDPVVGLLDFDCEAADGANIELASSALLHTEFPGQPVVLQLWHAFGAFKKFGFQSLDTPEGQYCAVFRYPSELFVDRMHGGTEQGGVCRGVLVPDRENRCARLAGVRRLVGEAKGDR